MPQASEFTQLVKKNSMRPIKVPSLYSLCVRRIKWSSQWEHCLLSVPIWTIKLDLFTLEMRSNPILFIATHYQSSDGELTMGSNCGYHIAQQTFVIGVFQASVCFDPKDYTEWVYKLSVDLAVDGDFERNVRDVLRAAKGSVDEKGARLCLESIDAWVEKHREPLQKLTV